MHLRQICKSLELISLKIWFWWFKDGFLKVPGQTIQAKNLFLVGHLIL